MAYTVSENRISTLLLDFDVFRIGILFVLCIFCSHRHNKNLHGFIINRKDWFCVNPFNLYSLIFELNNVFGVFLLLMVELDFILINRPIAQGSVNSFSISLPYPIRKCIWPDLKSIEDNPFIIMKRKWSHLI